MTIIIKSVWLLAVRKSQSVRRRTHSRRSPIMQIRRASTNSRAVSAKEALEPHKGRKENLGERVPVGKACLERATINSHKLHWMPKPATRPVISNQINLYTMTTIHQGVRQEDDWFSTSRPTRRTRTRSIAIKQNPRSSRHYEDSEVDVSQSTRMYDMATWQMYNRIIDYRQRNPLSSNYHQDSAEASSISKSNEESTSEQPMTAKKVEILDTFEGEVFQLDL